MRDSSRPDRDFGWTRSLPHSLARQPAGSQNILRCFPAKRRCQFGRVAYIFLSLDDDQRTEWGLCMSLLRRLRSSGWLQGIAVFVAATLVLAVVVELAARLGAQDFLQRLEAQTNLALKDNSPWELYDRYRELSEPDCAGAGSLQEMHRCQEIWGSILIRAPLGFYRLIREIFTQSPVAVAIDVMQLIVGFAAAIFLIFLLRPKETLFIPFAAIVLAMPLASLLSVPMLWVMNVGAKALGDVMVAATLPLYCGSWTALVCVGVTKWIENVLHRSASRYVEGVMGDPPA